MPLISFIIPYYNIPLPLVEDCLKSIINVKMDKGEREIIVVDDGAECDICEKLSTICGDIVYIRQENGGLSVARNTGIEAAKGKYIQFVDADDMLVPEVYSQCVEKLEQADADLLMFRYTGSNVCKSAVLWIGPVKGAAYMSRNNLRASACGYVFKKELLGDLRFFPGTYHEDEEFTPQLVVKAKTLYETQGQAYFYRLRSESITTARNDAHTEKRLNDVERILVALSDFSHKLSGEAYKGMARRVEQLTMDYIYNVLRLQNDRHRIKERLATLRRQELYPLPRRRYTLAYTCFRLLANSRLGLRLLAFIAVRKSSSR